MPARLVPVPPRAAGRVDGSPNRRAHFGHGHRHGSRGADRAGTRQLTVFVPSSTRDGASIDQAAWRDRVLTALGKMFRGATAFPPGRGVWRDDARDGKLLWDDTALVVSYAGAADFERCAPEFRRFLHAMGREAEQGEIGVVVDGDYFGISVYDPPEAAP